MANSKIEIVKVVMKDTFRKKSKAVSVSLDALSLEDRDIEAIHFASKLSLTASMQLFNPFHQKCASQLISVFCRVPLEKLPDLLNYIFDKVNRQLVQYSISVALIHRDDLRGLNIRIPSHVTYQPDMYFDTNRIKNEHVLYRDEKMTIYEIPHDFTATNQDPEHKAAYFREDTALNQHHRHWHETYPNDADKPKTVKKDRRGELFCYMHQQCMARYNFERLSNQLPLTEPLEDLREPIPEAYFPKLDKLSTSTMFSARSANLTMNNLRREENYVTISQMERWRDRIYDAIDRGYVLNDDGTWVKINEDDGIDILGNIIESSILSINQQYYGSYHNRFHMLLAHIHDPDNRFKESSGVMAYPETAMRDPVFYRLHQHIDDMLQYYKVTLPPYTAEQKQFQGINIESVKILPQVSEKDNELNGQSAAHTGNVIKTFWQKDKFDISETIIPANETPNEPEPKPIYVVFTHLQHDEFEYEIKVKNHLDHVVNGTVRIFLAPHANESGKQMPFNDQRRLFMEMDKFTADLHPNKINTIQRKSTQSTVTIPHNKSFLSCKEAMTFEPEEQLKEDNCGCGWPQHLLVGKGTPGLGLLCDLFVMITNYEEDKVQDSPLEEGCCKKSALSYCGVRDKKYPDKKPMGFPFDRYINDSTDTLEVFMTEKKDHKNKSIKFSNMEVVPVLVRHEEGPPKHGPTLTESDCKKITKSA